jgi:hypothetical protein
MSLLRRQPGISAEGFDGAWQAHAAQVRSIPGVLGYRQNVVVARELVKGTPSAYEDMPIDGIAELWFENAGSMHAAFSSAAAKAALDSARIFVSEVTPFTIAERQVV